MPVKQWTCLILALALAGCMSSPYDPTLPDDLQHVQAEVDLQILDETLRPPGIPNVDGLVFANNDWVALNPDSESDVGLLTNGTFVLEWDDSDGSEMSLTLLAEDFDRRMDVPMGPSPRTLDFPSVNVTWVDPLRVEVHGKLATGEVMRDAVAHVRFSYLGDELLVFASNC